MNKQENLWSGNFGDSYTERNKYTPEKHDFHVRQLFWADFIEEYQLHEKPVLEVGCGDGKNLHCFNNGYGIDINARALTYNYPGWSVYGKATDIPFKDNYFDLCFTCGLLIHIPPDDLLTVMGEMVRCSRKYVMFMEYYAEKEEMIEYHGEKDVLWKRPYKDIFLSSFSLSPEKREYKKQWIEEMKEMMKKYPDVDYNLTTPDFDCIDEGFLGKDAGFDDVTWWLFERTR